MGGINIAIIGGSGLSDPSFLDIEETVKISTPYGAPSAPVCISRVGGIRVAFLPRHGEGHHIPPHRINYRANIWALHELGIERIISVSAVGSLKERIRPGDVVIPDQFIDFTKRRDYTFYDGGRVYHVSMADPFCPVLRSALLEACNTASIRFHANGTYVCVEGPRFSTRAESRMYRQFADIIGMTLVPEVVLARELEMCYATIALVTDYDVWAEKPVDTQEVIRVMRENIEKARRVLQLALPNIPEKRNCPCARALENAAV